MNKAKKCIDFQSGEVDIPSVEEMKKALGNTMLGQIGKEKETMIWWHWAVLVFSFFTFLIVVATSGVLR